MADACQQVDWSAAPRKNGAELMSRAQPFPASMDNSLDYEAERADFTAVRGRISRKRLYRATMNYATQSGVHTSLDAAKVKAGLTAADRKLLQQRRLTASDGQPVPRKRALSVGEDVIADNKGAAAVEGAGTSDESEIDDHDKKSRRGGGPNSSSGSDEAGEDDDADNDEGDYDYAFDNDDDGPGEDDD